MATLNVGIKVNAAVSASGSSGTLYTAPANSYAMVTIYSPAGGANASSLTIGGLVMVPTNTAEVRLAPVFVGPGQVISATAVAGTGNAYRIVGVNLINTI